MSVHQPGRDFGLTNAQWYELRTNATRMRNWGFAYGQIAEQLGIDVQLAEHLVVDQLKEITSESAEMMAARQMVVANDIIRANYRAMLSGDPDASKVIQKTQDHVAKLFGLFAPSRVRVGVDDGSFAVDAVRLMRELGYSRAPEVIDAAPADDWVTDV